MHMKTMPHATHALTNVREVCAKHATMFDVEGSFESMQRQFGLESKKALSRRLAVRCTVLYKYNLTTPYDSFPIRFFCRKVEE